MPRIWRAIESSLVYGLFAAALAGAIAWNWTEKCLSGIGLLSGFGFGCPSNTMLVIAVLALALAVFVYSMWRGRGDRTRSGDKADQNEA
jgi:hypothetical protein